MGAILAILGQGGDPELGVRLQRMSVRSPYRGRSETLIDGPLALGIQVRGSDSSLVDVGNWIVAFHGFVGNWRGVAAERGWQIEEEATDAAKIAIGFEDLEERLFAKLRGEWAALIWDRQRQTIVNDLDAAEQGVARCRVQPHADVVLHFDAGELTDDAPHSSGRLANHDLRPDLLRPQEVARVTGIFHREEPAVVRHRDHRRPRGGSLGRSVILRRGRQIVDEVDVAVRAARESGTKLVPASRAVHGSTG